MMEILNVMVAYFNLFLEQNIWYQVKVCYHSKTLLAVLPENGFLFVDFGTVTC